MTLCHDVAYDVAYNTKAAPRVKGLDLGSGPQPSRQLALAAGAMPPSAVAECAANYSLLGLRICSVHQRTSCSRVGLLKTCR